MPDRTDTLAARPAVFPFLARRRTRPEGARPAPAAPAPAAPAIAGATPLPVYVAAAMVSSLVLVGRWTPLRLIGDATSESAPTFALLIATSLALFSVIVLAPVRRPAWTPPLVLLRFLLAALCTWLIATAWYAPDWTLALPKAIEIGVAGVTAFAAMAWMSAHRGFARALALSLLIPAVGLAVLGLLASQSLEGDRLALLGGGPNTYGRMVGLAVVLSVAGLREARGRPHRQFAFAAMAIVGASAVVLSGSRGALVGTAAGLLALAVVGRQRLRGLLMLLPLAVIGLYLVTTTDLGERVTQMWQARVVELTWERQYTAGRESLFASTWDMIQERPFTGWGLEAYRALGYGSYPHNFFLELLAEGGLVAGTLGAGFLGTLLVLGWKHRRYADAGLFGVCVMYIAAAQLSGDIFDNRNVFLFGLVSAAQASLASRRAVRQRRRSAGPIHARQSR